MVATKPAPDERAPAAPLAPRGPAAVLALQRSAGNAAVVAMLQREPVAEAERTTPPDLDPRPATAPRSSCCSRSSTGTAARPASR